MTPPALPRSLWARLCAPADTVPRPALDWRAAAAALAALVLILATVYTYSGPGKAPGLAGTWSEAAKTPADPRFEPYLPLKVVDSKSCVEICIARNQPILPFTSPCTRQSWCPTNYKPKAISEVCDYMCTQYRADCDTARFLVIIGDRPWGLGSDIHSRLVAMTMALSYNRILVFDFAKNRSLWTSPEDENPRCAMGNFDCYFEPSSNCQLPADWKHRAYFFYGGNISPEHKHQKILAHVLASSEHIDGLGEMSIPNFPHNRYPQLVGGQRTVLWWKPQLVQHMFRPSRYMLESSILPRIAKTFASHPAANSTLMPDRFISVFIRAGDKGIEVPLHGPKAYWPYVIRLSKQYNISDVYVSSDSAHIMNITFALAAKLTPELRIYYIDYPRFENGLDMAQLRHNLWKHPAIRSVIDIALTDLFIAGHASAWVGTLSSNWCRLQDEFRLGSGRYGTPYHSLDGTWVGLRRVDFDD